MSDILFIKTSSLGDVIHHMPAVTEARRHRPQARIAWLVEEAFAPLVRLHPAVDEVIAVATRRWRRALSAPATWREMATFARTLRQRRYDEIVDSQGLIRSAAMAVLARGRRHGYDPASIREPAAARCYDVGHGVGRELHAITRNRTLTGLALGYVPEGEIDYGLDRRGLGNGGGDVILLHGTARAEKEWPEASWVALAQALEARGDSIVLLWGSDAEGARSERIATALTRARVLDRQPLDGVARIIAGARFVIGVDTGLLHLAAALAVPLVAVFVGSEPGLTGPRGAGALTVVGGKARTPSVADLLAAIPPAQ